MCLNWQSKWHHPVSQSVSQSPMVASFIESNDGDIMSAACWTSSFWSLFSLHEATHPSPAMVQWRVPLSLKHDSPGSNPSFAVSFRLRTKKTKSENSYKTTRFYSSIGCAAALGDEVIGSRTNGIKYVKKHERQRLRTTVGQGMSKKTCVSTIWEVKGSGKSTSFHYLGSNWSAKVGTSGVKKDTSLRYMRGKAYGIGDTICAVQDAGLHHGQRLRMLWSKTEVSRIWEAKVEKAVAGRGERRAGLKVLEHS